MLIKAAKTICIQQKYDKILSQNQFTSKQNISSASVCDQIQICKIDSKSNLENVFNWHVFSKANVNHREQTHLK